MSCGDERKYLTENLLVKQGKFSLNLKKMIGALSVAGFSEPLPWCFLAARPPAGRVSGL
jgi:hypothetical protein